ncbi:MAG: chemotaxis protein CheX [Ruminococcus sp.]|nr:chemotaxis protein CheX [Ruminococcus sp.]
MFAQFFGGYLFNKKLVTAEALTQAFEDKKNTRMRLGVLAINAGLMTADQVEHVNVTQQSVDKRFGDLAVQLGYVTEEQVDALLSQQPTDYLLLGQTLVNNGALTNAEFETAINDYKRENKLTDSDVENDAADKLTALVSDFYHLDGSNTPVMLPDFVAMLFKGIIRFIDTDFTPLEAELSESVTAEKVVEQKLSGDYSGAVYACGDTDTMIGFATRFAGEEMGDVSGFAAETVGEFLNVTNGLFAVNESNEHGREISMEPQVVYSNETVPLKKPSIIVPVAFSFGTMSFVITL